jgi:uncharacterized protein (DUF58 family)
MDFFERSDVREFGSLELLAQQVVEGFIIGLHKSPFHGFSVEFAEHRLYNQGDSLKNVDWRVFARTGKLFSKRFEEETNLRCQIVIDTSSSMYFPEKQANKLEFSALAGAALMNLLQKQRDAFGLSLFSETVEQHTHCKSNTAHYKLLLTYLEQVLKPRQNKQTSAAQALHEIAENIHRRSLVVIFSDMLDRAENPEDLFSALQHLKYNKHEVILFHVTDKSKELDFEFENRPHIFIDMETGEKIKLMPREIKPFYTQKIHEYKNMLKMRCLQYKIEFIEADIKEGFRQILVPYLMKRNKMM